MKEKRNRERERMLKKKVNRFHFRHPFLPQLVICLQHNFEGGFPAHFHNNLRVGYSPDLQQTVASLSRQAHFSRREEALTSRRHPPTTRPLIHPLPQSTSSSLSTAGGASDVSSHILTRFLLLFRPHPSFLSEKSGDLKFNIHPIGLPNKRHSSSPRPSSLGRFR